MNKIYYSSSEEETKIIASNLANNLKKNDIIALNGELGAGKSIFVKGVCRKLGINEHKVKSPTFILLNIYENDMTVYHLDLYRISNIDELYYLGFNEFVESGGITLIEWANKIYGELPGKTIYITIEIIAYGKRKIIIKREKSK